MPKEMYRIITHNLISDYITTYSLPEDIVLADSLSTFRHQLTETLSVPAVLPRYCTVTVVQLCYCDTLSGPSSGNSYL